MSFWKIPSTNIMVLCAGATSDSFRRELRLKGQSLTLENIQELADDSRRAEKEEQDMNALRDEHIRAVGKGGTRQMSGKRPCNRCGKDNHSTSECTIPRSVKCSKCKKLGHIGPACSGGKPWQPAANGKQSTQGHARQVGPSEQDDATLHYATLYYHTTCAFSSRNVVDRVRMVPFMGFMT